MKSAKFLHCKKVAKFYAHSTVKGNQEFIMRRVKIMETDSGVNSSSHSLETRNWGPSRTMNYLKSNHTTGLHLPGWKIWWQFPKLLTNSHPGQSNSCHCQYLGETDFTLVCRYRGSCYKIFLLLPSFQQHFRQIQGWPPFRQILALALICGWNTFLSPLIFSFDTLHPAIRKIWIKLYQITSLGRA